MKKLILIPLLTSFLILSACQLPKKIYNNKEERKTFGEMTGAITKLPEPKTKGQMSLEEVISKRRSIREFSDKSLTKEQISQILWAAQGITDEEKGFRSAPSAGALYPLEIFVAVGENGVEEINPGVYQYLPKTQGLKIVLDKDVKSKLAEAALNQSSVAQAPVNIIITAEFEKTTSKYGERGIQYVWLEAGHAAENILLQATSLGLGAVTIGAFEDEAVIKTLDISSKLKPLYIIPIGKLN